MAWFEDNGFTDGIDPNGASVGLGTPPPIVTTPPPISPETSSASATSPAYHTGGYNAPASITARTGSAPSGWDQAKWADANHQSPKYAVAGIVQEAIANGAKALTPEIVAKIQAAYPGAKQTNTNSMDIPGIGETQVINDGVARWDPPGSWGPSGGNTGGMETSGNVSLGSLGSTGPQTAMNAPQTNLTSGGFQYGQAVPQTERVNYTPFTLPTREEALAADPGFQFGLDQGLGQLGAQASARGSIRDPNYRQGMTKFAIDYGNQHYSDAANRLFQANQANNAGAAGAVGANNATALGAQGQGFGQALGGFTANLGALGQQQQYGLGVGNLALGNKQADNSYALGQGNLALGQGNLALNKDQFGLQTQNQYWNQAFNNNAQTWDQYYKLAQLGYPQS